jgi:phage tail protein X
MMMTEDIVVRSDGYTLSLLIWEIHQKAAPGVLEEVLDLNPRLALQGTRLEFGTVIRMPFQKTPVQDAQPITLWS